MNNKKREEKRTKIKESVKEIKESKVKFSIGLKVFIVFITLVIIVLAGTTFSSYNNSKELLEHDLNNSSQQILAQIKKSIDSYFDNFFTIIDVLSYSESTKISANNKAQQSLMMKEMDYFIEKHPEIENIYFGYVDKDMVIRPDTELPEGYDPTNRPWFEATIRKGDITLSEVYEDVSTGSNVVTIAKPIYDSNNKLIGVLGLNVSLENLSQEVNSIKIGENGYPFIVQLSDNTALTHPSPELVGEPIKVKEIDELITNRETYVEYVFNDVPKYVHATYLDKYQISLLAVVDETEITKDLSANSYKTVVFAIGVFVLAIIGVLILILPINKNLRKLTRVILKVKEGDFTDKADIKTQDEIGLIASHLNDTIDSLGGLISGIVKTSDNVSNSAQTLAATAEETSASSDEVSNILEEIAKGASDQASESEKGVAIAQELATKFNELNNEVSMIFDSVNEVIKSNENGIKVIKVLDKSNLKAGEANIEITKAISELNDKTKSISTILDSITSIAEQTNLLALNASIEAARAGEHGRGFAVVADEIRKLAEQSNESAEDVRNIIFKIQEDSNNTVSSATDLQKISSDQSEAVVEVGDAFDLISKSILDITNKIDDMKIAVDNLNVGKDKIVMVVENISAVSEETAASVEETSATMEQQSIAVNDLAKSAEELNEISIDLGEEMAKFKI